MRFRCELLSLATLFLTIASAFAAEPAESGVKRKTAQRLASEGNFKDAFAIYQPLCLSPASDSAATAEDIPQAVACLNNLARTDEIDGFLEATATAHAEHWRVLASIAMQYAHTQHHGVMIAGKFVRGHHRGGGEVAHAADRDRVRALQLFRQAIASAAKDDDKAAVAGFYVSFAQVIQSAGQSDGSWRLQAKTDLSSLPDYELGWQQWRADSGAPVDLAGNPLYFAEPRTWDEAKNDGERWRWALAQAMENDPNRRGEITYQFASYMEQLYGVQTMQQQWWARGAHGPESDDETKKNESGTYDLHTLSDRETIAKLASGIKRFTLPDEFNYLLLYRKLAEEKGGYQEVAYQQLASVYTNRRQFPAAAKVWREAIAKFGPGPNDWRKTSLQQIVGNWCQFEPTATQGAKEGAKVGFRFRNAKKATFTAETINVELLLKDLKDYLKSDPGMVDWSKTQIENIGWRLVNEGERKYISGKAAEWSLALEPREAHFDRRQTITTPLQTAGAYLLTAKAEDGNTTQIVLWVADTVLVQKGLKEKNLFYAADAVTGSPIPGANLEFFGFRQEHLGNNKWRVHTANFAEVTNAEGITTPDPRDFKNDHQWLITARTKAGRLAFLGFTGAWGGGYYDAQYNEVKSFIATDRPVYRPAQKVQFKIWVRRAQYDQPETSDFAKQSFEVKLHNPKGEEIFKKEYTTDEYGGLTGEYALPKDASLGAYQIVIHRPDGSVHGANQFRVEEYKKPEYEVTIEAPTEPVMLGEKITAKISARYYFGSPVVNAKVKYKIQRTTHEQNWYPRMPWDWCYGPGYWWFAYDYEWYPGWNKWAGCCRPFPMWWHRPSPPPEIVAEVEREIGPDGTIQVEIDTLAAKELHGDEDHRYTISAEVTDDSRRVIVGEGKVLVARKPFRIYTWLDRGYYRTGEDITATFKAQTLDERAVAGKGTLTLYKVSYEQGKPSETPVRTWKLDTNHLGTAVQKLQATAKGQYRLSYSLTDSQGHVIEGGYLFTVVGEGFDGKDYRFDQLELVPDRADYRPGETVKLQINVDRPDAAVLLFIRPANGICLPPKLIRVKGKSAIEEIGVVQKDMPNFFVEAITVAGGKVFNETKEIIVPPEKRVLNVALAPSASEYKPGEKAKIQIRLTDFTGENYVGSAVVSVYDKSVEYISGGSNVPDIRDFFWKWRRHHQPQTLNSVSRYGNELQLPNRPGMTPLGAFGGTIAEEFDEFSDRLAATGDGIDMLRSNTRDSKRLSGAFGNRGLALRKGGALPGAPMAAMAADAAPAGAGFGGGAPLEEKAQNMLAEGEGGGGAALLEPTVRSNFADTAFWNGAITTDRNGLAEIEFNMPENLTAWKIRVWAMGHGTRVGSGEADVVTRKNLLVRLQSPRFFTQNDEVVLSANVHNYLKTEKDVAVSLELPGGELEAITALTTKVRIPAGGEKRVDWRCNVVREGNPIVRMKALTDEESDAMQLTLPSYVHGQLKTESWAGTIRPDQAKSKLTVNVPKERRPEQSLLEIRYSPSLAGAMVDALPYLAEFPYGCTEQTLNRFLPSVITRKTLLDMRLDLAAIREKRSNLNAQEIGDDRKRAEGWKRFDRNPVFEEEELDRMVKEGVKALTSMQLSDGGWGWFSGRGEHSWPHTTAVVVHGLQVASQCDVALVPGTIERGVEWLKRYQAEQVQLLKNAEAKKSGTNWKNTADDLDALVYMTLVDAKAENAEMRAFLYRDRNHLSVYAKAMFGLALHKTGDAEKLVMILKNIEQYVVDDAENETAFLKLPDDRSWWNWYGDEIEADAYYLKLLAAVDPRGVRAPRLVKYLLNNRKHATYWKNTRDTSLCVEAFAEYLKASGELRPEMTVEIWIDGKKHQEAVVNAENLFSFNNKFVLAGNDLTAGSHEIEIRRSGKGAVYFNAYLTNFTLEDHIGAAGLEVKVARKYYRLDREEKKVLAEAVRGQAVEQQVEKYRRTELTNLAEIKSGDLVEVELEIESKNDYEYLLFEDFKPSGFEPVELRSGYNGNAMGAYVEFRDERTAFFVRSLARGKHSVSYRLRAETPGKFAALPAKAVAMYAPELRGNSEEIKLRVSDK